MAAGFRRIATVAWTLVAALTAPGVAHAAPPPNDGPATAAGFSAYGAANGRPRDLQAVAELAGATADPGVPRCLGRGSFARTAWFVVPPAPAPQRLAIDAIGRTLDVLDLAAFVQPPGSTGPVTGDPNACAGAGAGGSAAAEESAAGLVLDVAPGRAVLVQVGRRGAAGAEADERALLSLDARPLAPIAAPVGDAAGKATPLVRTRRTAEVPLTGATLGEDDPAEPACPAPASVWRRLVPGAAGTRLISVEGRAVSALTVFSGKRPTADNARDCVVRAGYGALQMRVATARRRPLWIRIGTSQPREGATARLRIDDGAGTSVVDGGPGGFDPTPGGAGGGLPAACERARATRARVGGPRLAPRANRGRSVRVMVRIRRSALCDVRLVLVGPRGLPYAAARVTRLVGRRAVELRVEAASELGGRVRVPSAVKGRLR